MPTIKKAQQEESSAAVDCWGSKLLSETAGIEVCRSELLKAVQSRRGVMLCGIMHDQSTSSPEED